MGVEEKLKTAIEGKTRLQISGYSGYFVFLGIVGLDKVRAKPNSHLTHAEYEFPFYKVEKVGI